MAAPTGALIPPILAKPIHIRPLAGMWKFDPASEVPEGASPDMQNFTLRNGVLKKRPGFTQFPTAATAALGAPSQIVGLYSTHDVNDSTKLYAVVKTIPYKYNPGTKVWDIMVGAALTGGDTNLFSFENSQENLVFSQGVDNIMAAPFAGLAYAVISANAKPARYLCRFADRLFEAFTIETGATKPYRVRWPVNSDHTDWLGTGSGFRDNSEQPYFIKGLKKLQNSMAVYTERSILLAERTGLATAPASYQIAAPDTGLYAAKTLTGRNEFHSFLGNDDFYLYNGGALVPIGGPIRDLVFQNLNAGKLDQCFGEILSDSQEVLFFIVTSLATTPDKIWVYNYGRNIWYPWTCSGPKCSTLYRLDDTTTIAGLIGAISAQTWVFNASNILAAFPVMLTGNTDGKIYLWTAATPSDAGAAIDCYWTSKDFTAADINPAYALHKVTLKRVIIAYVDPGTPFTLEMTYSVNGGQTWSTPASVDQVTMGGSLVADSLDFAVWFREITGDRVRIKFRNNSATELPQISSLVFDLHIDTQTVA